MEKTVVLGIASGIAAFKTLALIKKLREEHIDVFVIMTHSATKMMSPSEFEKASGNKVATTLFEKNFDYRKILSEREVEHIALADKANVYVIAPATADIIAKLAHGLADDYLTTVALAVTAPVIICPSMNVNMWHNPLVQENISKLKSLGYIIIDPEKGMLACGYEGIGRLASISHITKTIQDQLTKSYSLKGKKIIITAGGTLEKIDDVRFIANRSSGKMGIALAEALYEKGADILLLRAKNSVVPRYHINEELFATTKDLYTLIKKHCNDFNYLYHSAAVSDFTVQNITSGKISSKKSKILKLTPQIKILEEIKILNPSMTVIAFKAEFESDPEKLKKAAYKKLIESHADAVIANDISKSDRGFEADNNEVMILLPNQQTNLIPLASKKEIAHKIIDYLAEQLP